MPRHVTYMTFSSLSWLRIVELIFCLHHMPSARVLAQDGDGTCDVPSVEPLASTSLTCHFKVDLNQTKSRFDVYLSNGVIQQKHQHVLGCTWISENLSCFVSPGYKFNNAASRKVTLEIPRASVEQTGTYSCVTYNMKPNGSISCDFNVTLAEKLMCDVPSVRLNTPTSLTCYFPEDFSKTRLDYTVLVYHYKNDGDKDQVLSYQSAKNSQNIKSTAPGYVFDGNVTDHLTLRIPSAVKEQEGNYSCHITGVGPGLNCSFTLEKVATMTSRSTCNISSVQETKPAELTCAFNADVNVTKKDFKVVRVGGEEIVSCVWQNHDLSCSGPLGYEINKTVTDHFVIKLIAASSEQNGKYVCQLMGAEVECFEPCELNVLMSARSTGEHSNISTTYVVLIAILIVFGAILLIALIVIIAPRSKRRRQTTRRQSQTENGPDQGLFETETPV